MWTLVEVQSFSLRTYEKAKFNYLFSSLKQQFLLHLHKILPTYFYYKLKMAELIYVISQSFYHILVSLSYIMLYGSEMTLFDMLKGLSRFIGQFP